MKITVEKAVKAPITRVWDAWNTPADILQAAGFPVEPLNVLGQVRAEVFKQTVIACLIDHGVLEEGACVAFDRFIWEGEFRIAYLFDRLTDVSDRRLLDTLEALLHIGITNVRARNAA